MDPAPSISLAPPAELSLRAALRRILVAWFFGAAWMSLTTGAVLTRFAKSVGLSEFGFGVLAAIPFLAALAQLPASYLLERVGHRKRIFLAANLLHRTLWLAIAAIPWVLPRAARPAGLVTLMLVSAVLNNVTAPAWYSWLVDLVPTRIRGRYFSRRTQVGQLVNLTLAVGAGVALDWAEQRSGLALSRMIGALLAVAAILGLVDILAFIRVPDPGGPIPRRSVGWGEMLRGPLANRSFRCYLAFTATLTFSTGYIGQFGWLYVLDVCHASNMQATLALVTVPQLAALCSIPFWGRMVDRLGCKPVATIACAGVIHGAAAWVLVWPGHWFPGYIGVLVAAFAWPGVDLASYNIMLGLVGGTRGAARSTAYVAITSVVVAASGTLSGLFGGLVGERLSRWQGDLFGLPLTYHGILFLLASVIRALALFWLRGIEESRSPSAQAALRHMANDMASNLQQTVSTPVRGLGRWARRRISAGRPAPRA